MKTTIDIPIQKISAVQKIYKINTKREAVIYALDETLRRHKIEKLIEKMGTFHDFMTQDDLRAMRDRDTTRDISFN